MARIRALLIDAGAIGITGPGHEQDGEE
jgi:hypothetical protein